MIKSKLISKATFYNKSGNKDIASFTEVASMNQTHSNVVLEIERSGVYDADALITTKKNLLLVVSPFLAPVPHRGKRNEPAFVENVAKFMADLRSTELNTIAKESSKNAEDLFKFDLLSRRSSC